MTLETKIERDKLYDIYRSILTEKQVEVLDQHYYHDYTAVEIADNLGVTRQAVHDTIKKAEAVMLDFEHKLGCLASAGKMERILSLAQTRGDSELLAILRSGETNLQRSTNDI